MQRDVGCGRHSSSGTRPANTVAVRRHLLRRREITGPFLAIPPTHQRGIARWVRIPARRHVHDCSRPARAASLRLGPLRSGSCRSPASRPRLAYSARHLHRPRITAPRHRRRDTGKPASIVQPRPRATHIMRHHRAACSLPPPRPPECRLSRGFCTALRVFKRV